MIDREILAQVRRIQVRTNRMVTDVMSGGYTSVFRGSGIEFDEVREFVEGDDIRSVDWNVTARTGRPHVKKYMEERELSVLFVLDVSSSTGFGTVRREVPGTAAAGKPAATRLRTVRDTAAEFCACLALAAARNNDKVGMIRFTDRVEDYVPAKKGSQHVLRLIREALADDAKGQGTDLAAALRYAARVQRKRAVVFVISDFLDVDGRGAATENGLEKPLRLLSRRHDVVAVRLLDPRTRALPGSGCGLMRVSDPETGRTQWLDTSARRVREAYTAAVARQDASMRASLRRARVDLLDVGTDQSLVDPIMKFFRMREMRGAHG